MMKRSFIKNKRGTTAFFVILEILILLLVFGLIILFLTFFLNLFFDQYQLAGECTTGICAQTIERFKTAFGLFDTGAFLLVIGGIIGVGWGSFRVSSRKIMYLLFIIESVILGFISYYFSFVYVTYITFDQFALTTALFPKTIPLLSNMHWIAFIMMIVATITYFRRDNDEQQAPTLI